MCDVGFIESCFEVFRAFIVQNIYFDFMPMLGQALKIGGESVSYFLTLFGFQNTEKDSVGVIIIQGEDVLIPT